MTTTAHTEPNATADPRGAGSTESILNLPLGLLGFEGSKNYALIHRDEEQPFMWLQMLDAPQHAFLVVPPTEVTADYRPSLSDDDVSFLKLSGPDDAVILNIVTLRNGSSSTVNLKGPVVINRHTRVGKQVIPTNAASFPLQHPLPAAC